MLMTLASFYLEKRDLKKALSTCDLALKYYPNYADAFAQKARVYWTLSDIILELIDITQSTTEQKAYVSFLESTGNLYYRKATSLGWVSEPKAKKEQYLKEVRIMREKSKND